MARVSENGYIERKTTANKSGNRTKHSQQAQKKTQAAKGYRDWFLVKHGTRNQGIISIGRLNISIPSKYIGKRVRFKIELYEDETTFTRYDIEKAIAALLLNNRNRRKVIADFKEKLFGKEKTEFEVFK